LSHASSPDVSASVGAWPFCWWSTSAWNVAHSSAPNGSHAVLPNADVAFERTSHERIRWVAFNILSMAFPVNREHNTLLLTTPRRLLRTGSLPHENGCHRRTRFSTHRSRDLYPGLFKALSNRGCMSEISGRTDSTSIHASDTRGECNLRGKNIQGVRRGQRASHLYPGREKLR
jgi:hypothetical protein